MCVCVSICQCFDTNSETWTFSLVLYLVRKNRQAIEDPCDKKTVLNCFSFTLFYKEYFTSKTDNRIKGGYKIVAWLCRKLHRIYRSKNSAASSHKFCLSLLQFYDSLYSLTGWGALLSRFRSRKQRKNATVNKKNVFPQKRSPPLFLIFLLSYLKDKALNVWIKQKFLIW